MTALLFILALVGWLIAIFALVGISILSLYIASQQAEAFQKILSEEESISAKKSRATRMWSFDPKKEIPFGD